MGEERPELVLIRHAPVAEPGVLNGRRDVAARLSPDAIHALRQGAGRVAKVVVSPALRCRQTAKALWPDAEPTEDARLWEQDFGDFEGRALQHLPDLGEISPDALAAHRWPGGESFADVCSRAAPALQDAAGMARDHGAPVAVVAHAGVIRAALALVTGHVPGALAFEIAPLSVTRLGVWRGAPVSVRSVNRVFA
ncbi:histidine phosphatase family protein [Sagittula stellata]